MRHFTAVMAFFLLFLSSTVSSKAEIVTDDRFFQQAQTLEGLDPKDYDSVIESRDAALADLKLLEEAAEKVSEFRQANERSYGLPSSVEELERMLNLTKDFLKNDVKEIQVLSKSLLKKYKVSSLQELGALTGRIINPGGSIRPVGLPSGHNFLEQNLQWVDELLPRVEEALAKAKEEANQTDAKLSEAKALTDFPEDSYSSGDIGKIKEQMITALTGTVIESNDEVLNIAVTGDWDEGVYSDTKLPYRKIRGTVLFADNDGDGASRYTSYTFISNKIDGDWKALKFKGFNTSIEGWAKPEKGSRGGGKGFIGSLIWLLLVVVNLAAGLIAGQDLLKSKIAAIEKVTSPLQPFSTLIGVAALGAGLLGFILSVLSLHILAGIIPQITAVALGLALGREFIKGKAAGKLKEEMEKHEASLQQINAHSQLLGVAGLAAGILYLILGGALYVI